MEDNQRMVIALLHNATTARSINAAIANRALVNQKEMTTQINNQDKTKSTTTSALEENYNTGQKIQNVGTDSVKMGSQTIKNKPLISNFRTLLRVFIQLSSVATILLLRTTVATHHGIITTRDV
jgi:hypothetical protein